MNPQTFIDIRFLRLTREFSDEEITVWKEEDNLEEKTQKDFYSENVF